MDRLQAMRVFARVAELGSFTRAAEALELSRARVSEAVASLEQTLGTRLVHRTTRRLSLSDDGRAYLARVAQILADVEEAEAEVRSARSVARGRLRVAMPIALARQFVVPALPKLLTRHPGLGLEVRLENRAVDLLEEGVDCGLSYGKPSDEALVARRVGTTRLLTLSSRTYAARRGVPREPVDLVEHECIAFLALATGRPSEWIFSAPKTSAASAPALVHRPQGRLAFNSMEACVEAAEAGLGLTQVLSSLAYRAIRSRKLKPVLGAYTADGPALYAIYPPNRQLSARMRAFIDFLSQVFLDAERRERVGRVGRTLGP